MEKYMIYIKRRVTHRRVRKVKVTLRKRPREREQTRKLASSPAHDARAFDIPCSIAALTFSERLIN